MKVIDWLIMEAKPIKSERVYWIDAVRGLAIIAVVAGHANLGIIQAGLTGDSAPIYKQITVILYLLHMPLFAFLFGFNLPGSLRKNFTFSSVFNRAMSFLYLYIVWSLIQGSFEVLGSRYSNGETRWADVFNLTQPIAHLWYLPWIFLIYIFLVLTRPWRSAEISLILGIFFAILSWLTWGVSYPIIFGNGLALYLFAFIGTLVDASRLNSIKSWNSKYLILLSGIFLFITFLVFCSQNHISTPTLPDPQRNSLSIISGITVSFSGIVGVVLGVAMMSKYRRFILLEKIGFYSLQIYLMHLLVTPTVRILLVKLGISAPIPVLLISIAAGVIIPLWIAQIASKISPWIFSPPRFLTISQKV